ncbi:synaptic vesicle 2-related protein isoform X7 [Zeugodacus cucurbitae]|uniref:synaptic vesicle 2-related protein isoform X7 n=1 Tax=Zeugodacus cucurbitae TaxID=28588 RepID=UPI0023D91642|nr:synaptic vesicle 2-related protein isoform X7 [Zeugodacus cucurbitae]
MSAAQSQQQGRRHSLNAYFSFVKPTKSAFTNKQSNGEKDESAKRSAEQQKQKKTANAQQQISRQHQPSRYQQTSGHQWKKQCKCFWALGACFEIALALAIYPNFGWRWLLGFSTAPLLLFTSLTPWLTESARYHTLNGNYEKAVRVLEQIAKDNNRQMLIGRLTNDCEINPPHQLKALFKPELRKITLLLWFLWMSCAFCYYGLVLISAEVFLSDKIKQTPSHNCNSFNTKDFMDLMWITFSEFPGIFSTIAAIKRYGKKKTMALQFIVFSVCISILSLSNSRIYTTAVLFLARGVISGLFQAAYIYTPDIYPNNLRSLGVGGCSTIARIGAMVTPFVSQVLFQSSASSAFMVYTLIGLSSAVASILLPESQILV